MKTYNCLIVEDSEASVVLLKNYLNDLALFETITVCSTLDEASLVLMQQAIDLIFLDVEIHTDNGLDLVKQHKTLPPVIVMSAHAHYAVNSYDLDVSDYMQKPFTKARLLRSLNRALNISIERESVTTEQAIFLKVRRRLKKFMFNEIDYIEALGIYAKIHSGKTFEVVNESLAVLEKRLPTKLFRRVNKSFIVNLERITSYNQNNVFIDEEKIQVGSTYRDNLPNIFRGLENAVKDLDEST
ncbi:MAG: DNA-binding response regulator [Cytophagales bacterium]|nr:MAG: DNA-binding response regulator [Cytophagales bacterium]